MAQLSVEFHAAPDELADLLGDLLNDPAVFTSFASGSPLEFRREGAAQGCTYVAFTLDEPRLGAASMSDFSAQNPTTCFLHVGRLRPDGLGESWFAANCDDELAMKRWNRAARKLRSAMRTGASAVNPKTGAACLLRAHRFTPGAQRLFAQGVPMLPFAGGCRIQLPPPETQASPNREGL